MKWLQETLPTQISEPTPVPSKPSIPFLLILNGEHLGKRFLLKEGDNILGRVPEASIYVPDPQISRRHGNIMFKDGVVRIEDLKSTNGIFVDGIAIENALVNGLSRISIGNTLLKLVFKDPTELKMEDELYRAATIDALTGIGNRSSFMEGAHQALPYARRNNLPLSLVMIDADFFKEVNDTHGHPAGDYVLKRLGHLFEKEKRQEDLLGRYGGEEFIMLMKGNSNDNASQFCERLRQAIENYPFVYENTQIPLTISIGFFTAKGPDLPDLTTLIEKADRALYKAKELGRNRVETSN